MSPSLDSFTKIWTAITRFDTRWVRLLVSGIAGVATFLISWELSELWEQLFGYSSIITVVTTVGVFFALYFCLSYFTSAVLQADEQNAH